MEQFPREFVEENGLAHPSSFSFDGQAVHFMVDTEEGPIFATGIMESNLVTCSGSGGGTLSGPLVGDLGDWRGEWAATAIPTPLVQPSPSSQNTNNSPRLSPMLFCFYSPIIVVGLFSSDIPFPAIRPLQTFSLFQRNSFLETSGFDFCPAKNQSR